MSKNITTNQIDKIFNPDKTNINEKIVNYIKEEIPNFVLVGFDNDNNDIILMHSTTCKDKFALKGIVDVFASTSNVILSDLEDNEEYEE